MLKLHLKLPPPPKDNVNLERTPEQDTVTVFGKKIKKKTVGTGILLTFAATAIGAFCAAKRGKVINNGKEAGFFGNLGEGLKSIFTKEGRQNYELAQKAAQNTASAADRIEEAAVQNTPPAPAEISEKPLPDMLEDVVTESKKDTKPVSKKKKGKRKSAPMSQNPPAGSNPHVTKDAPEPNFARLDAIDPELQARERAALNGPKKGLWARLFGGKEKPANVEENIKKTPAAVSDYSLTGRHDIGNGNLSEPNFARLDAIDPELNRVDGTKYIEEKKKGGFFSFLKKKSGEPAAKEGINRLKPAQSREIGATPLLPETGGEIKKDLPLSVNSKKLQPFEYEEIPPNPDRFNIKADKNIPYADFREITSEIKSDSAVNIFDAQTEALKRTESQKAAENMAKKTQEAYSAIYDRDAKSAKESAEAFVGSNGITQASIVANDNPSASFRFDKIDEYEATYITGTDGKSYKAPKKSVFSKLAGLFKR